MADVFNKNMEDIEVMEVSEASLLGETAATSARNHVFALEIVFIFVVLVC